MGTRLSISTNRVKLPAMRTTILSYDPTKPAEGTRGFKIVVKTDNSGSSDNNQFRLPLRGGLIYSFWIDWGEGGKVEYFGSDTSPTHTYTVAGTYNVSILGTFPTIFFDGGGDTQKIIDITQWGTNKWTTLHRSFEGCEKLVGTYTDTPNFLAVETASEAFLFCELFNGRVNWDMPNLTTANRMFRFAKAFNQPVSEMNAPIINNGSEFAEYTYIYNQPWLAVAPENVTEALKSTSFDQDISGMDISRLTNATNFLQGTDFSDANYDLALVSFAAQAFNDNVVIHFGLAKYGPGAPATARALLVSHGWTITDGGPQI